MKSLISRIESAKIKPKTLKGEEIYMSEKRLNNTIFLMYLVTESYCQKYSISRQEFLELDNKYKILNYISECPDVFDWMKEDEMVEEIDEYISQY